MMTTPVTRVRERAARFPTAVALRHKKFGIWQEVTWADYWEQIELVGHALLELGVQAGDRVAIHADNRPEWLATDLGALAIRATSVGIYPTSPAAEVGYLLSDSGGSVLVAENQEQVDKALDVAAECPALRHVIYLDPRGIRGRYDADALLSWEDFLAHGQRHREGNPQAVTDALEQARGDDVATLVYTSGTTGPPKGAMLSVDNVEFAIRTLVENGTTIVPRPGPRDLSVSYLPLSHVAERLFTTWFNAGAGTQVAFAESIETVALNLAEVQPTILFGVPRIWEKLMAGILTRIGGSTWLKRRHAEFWVGRAVWIGARLADNGGRHTVGTRLVSGLGFVLCYRALQLRLGLRHVRHASSAAAPIAPDVLRFFMGIGVPMHELYGMTENTGIATANRPGRVRLGTVGEAHDGIELRVDEGTGEILTRHPGVFLGYWRNPEGTATAIDADGWLHTGDVGEWVDGTYLRITDRMKDLIITSGGKNISPSEIENALKASPYIKEAIVVGDGLHYLTALIGIELDSVGEWAQRRRLAFSTYADLADKPEVVELVTSVVGEVNGRLAQVEQIKEFRLLPKELDHEDGELTATQKVKRSAVSSIYSELVTSMYAGSTR